MGISRMGQVDWFDFYPVEEKLKVASPSSTVIVDIGGGMGHDVTAFHKRFPHVPGKVVFEDLPSVVEAGIAKGLPQGVEGIVTTSSRHSPQPSRAQRFIICALFCTTGLINRLASSLSISATSCPKTRSCFSMKMPSRRKASRSTRQSWISL